MTDYCNHICLCSEDHSEDCRNPICSDEAKALKEVPTVTNSDPSSWIQASAKTLADTLSSKNGDYAPTGEFSNFERAAQFVGGGMDPLAVMLAQVGIKYTRIESLHNSLSTTNFESIADSLLDLAGYAIIAHAYLSANLPEDLPAWDET